MQNALGAVFVAIVVGLFAACTPKPASKSSEPQIVVAQAGAVQEVVQGAMARAKTEGRRLVVYVGASWCEPCHVFLDGVSAGKLPATLSDIVILKFDNDADDARLAKANYGGQMIPRFVLPGADGTGSEFRFEGSVKGDAAMGNIVPRLEALLANVQD